MPLPLQLLYHNPPDKEVDPQLTKFCFPTGIQPVLLEKTPSMSAFNEVIYSQAYQTLDDSSFFFMLQVVSTVHYD